MARQKIEWVRNFIFPFLFMAGFGIICYYIGFYDSPITTGYQCATWLQKIPSDGAQLPSRITANDIIHENDSITLLGNYTLVQYADSNSMLPLVDLGTKGIVKPIDENTYIQIGDVISYTLPRNRVIAHRVVDIGVDGSGYYYITKGDNLVIPDPEKVRPQQIKHVLVGVLY